MLYKSSVDGRIVSSSPNTQIHLHHICFTFKNALQPCIPSAQVYISTFILKRLKAKCPPASKTLAQSKFFLFVFLLYHPFLPFSHVVIHCGRLADSPLGGPRGLRSVIVAGFVGCCPRCCGPTLSAEALSKDLTSSHLTRSVSHTHVQDKESTQPAPVHESRCVIILRLLHGSVLLLVHSHYMY